MKKDMMFDAHIHITSPEILSNLDICRAEEPYFDLLSGSPKNSFVTADDLVERMDELGIGKAVVFGFGFSKMKNCRSANDYTIEAAAKYPDRLIGFATVNPSAPGVETELQRCHDAGLKGVGEIMAEGQGTDIGSREQMSGLCGFCGENNWPVLVHLNEEVGHYYPGKTGDSIGKGAALAENFPGTKFIFAHLGGGLCFYESMPEVRKALSNVSYDTAAVPFLYENRIYNVLKTLGILDRIVFGSDYPLLAPEKYMPALDSSSLTEEEKKGILGMNLAGILGE